MSNDRPSATSRAQHPTLDELRAEAMRAARKPRAFGWFYVLEHMVRAMRAYGWTIVASALGQPLLYLFGLALGLAALISTPVDDGGVSVRYLVFVAPALIAAATIAVATEEMTYPVMSGFKWRLYFFGFSASPISSAQIATGVALAPASRMLAAAVPYYLIVWIFGGVETPATGWLAIGIGVLAGLAFGTPLMAYAASIEDDKGQFALVQRFIFMPMFLFSGTFYPLTNLEWWLAWIGWISPLWHASELGRMAMYGKPIGTGMMWLHIAYLVILAVGGYLMARRMFSRRLEK